MYMYICITTITYMYCTYIYIYICTLFAMMITIMPPSHGCHGWCPVPRPPSSMDSNIWATAIASWSRLWPTGVGFPMGSPRVREENVFRPMGWGPLCWDLIMEWGSFKACCFSSAGDVAKNTHANAQTKQYRHDIYPSPVGNSWWLWNTIASQTNHLHTSMNIHEHL